MGSNSTSSSSEGPQPGGITRRQYEGFMGDDVVAKSHKDTIMCDKIWSAVAFLFVTVLGLGLAAGGSYMMITGGINTLPVFITGAVFNGLAVAFFGIDIAVIILAVKAIRKEKKELNEHLDTAFEIHEVPKDKLQAFLGEVPEETFKGYVQEAAENYQNEAVEQSGLSIVEIASNLDQLHHMKADFENPDNWDIGFLIALYNEISELEDLAEDADRKREDVLESLAKGMGHEIFKAPEILAVTIENEDDEDHPRLDRVVTFFEAMTADQRVEFLNALGVKVEPVLRAIMGARVEHRNSEDVIAEFNKHPEILGKIEDDDVLLYVLNMDERTLHTAIATMVAENNVIVLKPLVKGLDEEYRQALAGEDAAVIKEKLNNLINFMSVVYKAEDFLDIITDDQLSNISFIALVKHFQEIERGEEELKKEAQALFEKLQTSERYENIIAYIKWEPLKIQTEKYQIESRETNFNAVIGLWEAMSEEEECADYLALVEKCPNVVFVNMIHRLRAQKKTGDSLYQAMAESPRFEGLKSMPEFKFKAKIPVKSENSKKEEKTESSSSSSGEEETVRKNEEKSSSSSNVKSEKEKEINNQEEKKAEDTTQQQPPMWKRLFGGWGNNT